MAGSSFEEELLQIFPHGTSLVHGRSRHKARHTRHSAHGRARSHHVGHHAGHYTRAPIDKLARIDPWKHVGQARGQG